MAREGQLRADRRGKAAERGLDPDRVDDVFTAILRLSVALQEEEAMDQGLGEDPG